MLLHVITLWPWPFYWKETFWTVIAVDIGVLQTHLALVDVILLSLLPSVMPEMRYENLR